jgi:hypothetical protein
VAPVVNKQQVTAVIERRVVNLLGLVAEHRWAFFASTPHQHFVESEEVTRRWQIDERMVR